MKYERMTEKRNVKNVIPLRNSVCGIDVPKWEIAEKDNEAFLSGDAVNRLAELEDKIENGTLIELPCKVGDTVYWVFELVKNNLEILEGKIRGLSISQNNTSWFSVIYEYGLTFEHTFKDCWNKTVFLTKAEAEKKLKELQGE